MEDDEATTTGRRRRDDEEASAHRCITGEPRNRNNHEQPCEDDASASQVHHSVVAVRGGRQVQDRCRIDFARGSRARLASSTGAG